MPVGPDPAEWEVLGESLPRNYIRIDAISPLSAIISRTYLYLIVNRLHAPRKRGGLRPTYWNTR
jgi:hypothetical protein